MLNVHYMISNLPVTMFFHLLRKYHHNEFHDRECYYQICSVLDSNGVAM